MMLPLPKPPLNGSGFVLRPFQETDFEAAREFSRDPTAARWVPPLPADSPAGVVELFEQYRQAGELLHLVIADGTNDAYLGEVMVVMCDDQIGELGIGMVEQARGRGIATDAFDQFVRWSAANLKICRLQVLVAPENTPALLLAERVGFRREGVLRAYWPNDEGRVDAIMLSLLPEDLF
jgi:RimJ/RimL family protein N-acetyltransferase